MATRIDSDRDARAKRVAQEIIDLERKAREAKTARLREARIAQEAANPQPAGEPDAKPKAPRPPMNKKPRTGA
ncbi:hypothetical protein D3227_36245 [Mesorhizobium waimense]|uniref:Uncharacterized protein n=1 Tax=Mesorhizobium waimense TaxID=1300307 RepID=A0A3A5K4Z2_9HYPH|nr:hypothetical protein D3227_36245 [Mesorhizobium waimense]